MNKHFYTDAEREYIRENYPHRPTKEMAEKLGVSVSSVWNQANVMGLKKTKECIARMSKEKMKDPNHPGRKHYFKPGHKPWNQNKKGWCAPGTEKTWFQKGHEPHNTNYDGHKRLTKDGYIEIRVRKGKYKLLHHHIWEREYGPIPPGNIIIFRDGNPMNVQLSNLKMITKSQNMKRNSFANFPPEARELLQIKRVLTRKINQKIEDHE